MSSSKPNLLGIGVSVWIALALFLLAAIGFPVTMVYMYGTGMSPETKLDLAQLVVSILGFGGAIAAFAFALIQYRRTEQWRRSEFIAKEIKEFESDPLIANALLMVDWGSRDINLFLVSNPKPKDYVEITRVKQWKALLPHTVKKDNAEYSTFTAEELKSRDDSPKTFTDEEARIRDTYDAFLTRLDRFANFIKSGLISSAELEPFLYYWIDAITKNEDPKTDAAWRCTLLTYINFYEYDGVKYLFKCYGKNLEPKGRIYSDVRNSLEDKVLGDRLFASIPPHKGKSSPT
jgi:hypothetical protein